MQKIFFLLSILFLQSCQQEEVVNYKDLGQNMMDLKLYQENLGDEIKAKRLEDASWFLEGTDSILLVVSIKFKEHRKLFQPFSYHYKKELKDPINGIRHAIRDNDTAKALKNYRLLVTNCNNCHIDHEVDKEVKF